MWDGLSLREWVKQWVRAIDPSDTFANPKASTKKFVKNYKKIL